MKKYNVIMVINKTEDHLLLCLRTKDPHKGLYNLVGGKIEASETGEEAAYRELEEETGISRNDIVLTHLMDFQYHIDNILLESYVGKLTHDVQLQEEVNPLSWHSINNDFYDNAKYAGGGNIGHILHELLIHKDQIYKISE